MLNEKSLLVTYRWGTGLSILLMLSGWLLHLSRHDVTNLLLKSGFLLLLLTPVFALLHLLAFAWWAERRLAWLVALVLLLIGIAYLVGKV